MTQPYPEVDDANTVQRQSRIKSSRNLAETLLHELSRQSTVDGAACADVVERPSAREGLALDFCLGRDCSANDNSCGSNDTTQ